MITRISEFVIHFLFAEFKTCSNVAKEVDAHLDWRDKF